MVVLSAGIRFFLRKPRSGPELSASRSSDPGEIIPERGQHHLGNGGRDHFGMGGRLNRQTIGAKLVKMNCNCWKRGSATWNIQERLRRIAKLGIANFETVADIERWQRDLLRRLERSSIDPERYEGLADCGPAGCGREECMEACFFGTFRRRLRQVRTAFRLLEDARPPFHEVRVSRALWSRPFGKLDEASIAAAKQLNRRRLDSLYIREGVAYHRESVIAVGSFKVAPSPPNETERWICEIHQVVAGAQKKESERALSTRSYRGETRSKVFNPFDDYLRVQGLRSSPR